jgi:hypothetical protein
MSLTKKTNHVDEAIDNLISLFKTKPNFRALITALVNQIQDLENAGFELLLERGLETAIGTQLDGVGSILNVLREGRSDDIYRIAIKARILLNSNNGSPEEIIDVLYLVSNIDIDFTEYYPAALTAMITEGITYEEAEAFHNILQEAKLAGVGAHLIWGEDDPAGWLRFDVGPGWDQGRWVTTFNPQTEILLKSRKDQTAEGVFLMSSDGSTLKAG